MKKSKIIKSLINLIFKNIDSYSLLIWTKLIYISKNLDSENFESDLIKLIITLNADKQIFKKYLNKNIIIYWIYVYIKSWDSRNKIYLILITLILDESIKGIAKFYQFLLDISLIYI